MSDFNNMTIMAAVQVIESFHSASKLEGLEIEWAIQGRCRTDSKAARIADLAKIAIDENPNVITPNGRMPLERAIVEKALTAPSAQRDGEIWRKLLSGLRFDGFEVNEGEEEVTTGNFWKPTETNVLLSLQKMMPEDVPGLNFREAENEVIELLSQHNMDVPKGHLKQALSAFSRGEWASANAQLRTFFESYLDEIAVSLDCEKSVNSKGKREYLGKLIPPFLSEGLNEWSSGDKKPTYIQGLMNRLHPEGSHAGLSEEDDATFRLQITLITARLLLRRFSKYIRQKS